MPAGRPPKWETPAQVQLLIDDYFANTSEEEWTITGLAIALDTWRSVLVDYEGKDEFTATIKKAKEKVHNAYEKDLRKKGRSGDIFALKNFGWRDEKTLDHKGSLTIVDLIGGIDHDGETGPEQIEE